MTAVRSKQKSLLVKGLSGRAWVAGALVVYVAFRAGSPASALPHGAVASAPGISVVAEGSAERWIVDLGGVLVAALSPETAAGGDGLLLLVRPPRKPDGPRRLLRLRLEPEPSFELLADGLDGGIDSLAAAELAAGQAAELIVGGPDRLATLGPLSSLAAPLAMRTLFEVAGFDPRALDPGLLRRGLGRRFAVVEPGALRLWDAAAGTWTPPSRLPLEVARTASGLRLSSPPVVSVRSASGEIFLAGPEAVGSTRLKCLRIDAATPGEAPEELWAALPGPEKVSQSWPFEIDGVPVLVVRTQASDEVNLFERQRLRVLPLAADRTRAGGAPTLAVELDSKRWHETAIALGDVDGDGHDDLLAAFPEGLSGSDLVMQWWRGEGRGRFESRAHRSDLKKAPGSWALVAAPEPGLLLVGNGRMELRAFSAAGKSAIAERAGLTVPIPALPGAAAAKAEKKVTIAVGGEGDSSKVENIDPEALPLGAVELDGRAGAELLAVQGSGNGNERLILLRARND